MSYPPPPPLPSPQQWLSSLGLEAKKSFGQNFLSDPSILDRMAEQIRGAEIAIEIGPGLGALTTALLKTGIKVIAIERDRDLIPILTEHFSEAISSGQLRILEGDAKTVDYDALIEGKTALIGNLPYQITGQLLELACGLSSKLCSASFLVQLEVAERIVSPPRTKTYGALSVFCQASFDGKKAFLVKPGAFHPKPNVNSAVVRLVPRSSKIPESIWFRQLVWAGFEQRRKTLRNSWSKLASTEIMRAAAESVGIRLEQRAEELTVEQFGALAVQLEKEGHVVVGS